MIDQPRRRRPVRYAVIGLGAIAQGSVLPAFARARGAQLAALVSDDPDKLRELGARYRVPAEARFGYDGYDEALARVDAVYICLPNHLHHDYTVRASQHGVHVLCEKPLATTRAEAEAMIAACEDHGVLLMTAYRLHLEAANLAAIAHVESGRIGTPRYLVSAFSFPVEPGNVRVRPVPGAGPLWDIGVYCINAARYLFRDEPLQASALRIGGRDPRIEEGVAATLRFPGDRMAQFTVSFGAAQVQEYRLVGTEGSLLVDPAYGFGHPLVHQLTVGGRTRRRRFPPTDQFAAELTYFSRCIRDGEEPEPSGIEGLADVAVVEALRRSMDEGRPVAVDAVEPRRRPEPAQRLSLRPARQR